MPLGFPLLGIRSMAPEWNIPDKWWFSVEICNYKPSYKSHNNTVSENLCSDTT